MHQYLYGAVPKGHVVDHIDKNKLNNRKSNLRANTRSGNAHNGSKAANTTSRYRGVHARGKSFRAQINIGGKKRSLGDFKSEHDAARAFNAKATDLHGDKANLNEIKDEPDHPQS